MKSGFAILLILTGLVMSAIGQAPAKPKRGSPPGGGTYLIANEDGPIPHDNAVVFFQASGTQLTLQSTVVTNGFGIGGGFFGTPRLVSPPDSNAQCVYASEAGSNDIAALSLPSMDVAGLFYGSDNDSGSSNGIGLAVNSNYLYAGYPDSSTIATFAVGTGCQLEFLSDVSVSGLNGGFLTGMALHGNLLVVTYGDGSIESFDISAGAPLSNSDLQNSTGYLNDENNMPAAADITQDGHYAIFGDTAVATVVEVSDISSGKLKPTVPYTVGGGPVAFVTNVSSSTVRLSPDGSLLYIGNSQGGTVSAAFFNKATGQIRTGCISPTLRSYYNTWWFIGSLATRDNTGTGGVIYAAEYPGSIAVLSVQSNGTTCTLTEAPGSPTQDPFSQGVLSLWVYPPRLF